MLFDELLLHHYFLFSGRKSLTFGCLLILLEKLLLFGFSAIFGIVFRHFIQILPWLVLLFAFILVLQLSYLLLIITVMLVRSNGWWELRGLSSRDCRFCTQWNFTAVFSNMLLAICWVSLHMLQVIDLVQLMFIFFGIFVIIVIFIVIIFLFIVLGGCFSLCVDRLLLIRGLFGCWNSYLERAVRVQVRLAFFFDRLDSACQVVTLVQAIATLIRRALRHWWIRVFIGNDLLSASLLFK